jgi:hypothetical protein
MPFIDFIIKPLDYSIIGVKSIENGSKPGASGM